MSGHTSRWWAGGLWTWKTWLPHKRPELSMARAMGLQTSLLDRLGASGWNKVGKHCPCWPGGWAPVLCPPWAETACSVEPSADSPRRSWSTKLVSWPGDTLGSTHASRCHSMEDTKLFITRMHPLKDICGNFHLFRRPATVSKTLSQFLHLKESSPRYTPRYLKPPLFHLNPPGKVSCLLNSSLVAKASLFPQLTLAEDNEQQQGHQYHVVFSSA